LDEKPKTAMTAHTTEISETVGEFKTYQRQGSIEARPAHPDDWRDPRVSISLADKGPGFSADGMVARNPENHADMWYIAPEYFAKHYRAAAPVDVRVQGEQVFDVDALAWQSIKDAAAKSPWIPPQYAMNDWVSDVCEFLQRQPRDPVDVRDSAGVVVVVVPRALVERAMENCQVNNDHETWRALIRILDPAAFPTERK
jgi:hypothetical protein